MQPREPSYPPAGWINRQVQVIPKGPQPPAREQAAETGPVGTAYGHRPPHPNSPIAPIPVAKYDAKQAREDIRKVLNEPPDSGYLPGQEPTGLDKLAASGHPAVERVRQAFARPDAADKVAQALGNAPPPKAPQVTTAPAVSPDFATLVEQAADHDQKLREARARRDAAIAEAKAKEARAARRARRARSSHASPSVPKPSSSVPNTTSAAAGAGARSSDVRSRSPVSLVPFALRNTSRDHPLDTDSLEGLYDAPTVVWTQATPYHNTIFVSPEAEVRPMDLDSSSNEEHEAQQYKRSGGFLAGRVFEAADVEWQPTASGPSSGSGQPAAPTPTSAKSPIRKRPRFSTRAITADAPPKTTTEASTSPAKVILVPRRQLQTTAKGSASVPQAAEPELGDPQPPAREAPVSKPAKKSSAKASTKPPSTFDETGRPVVFPDPKAVTVPRSPPKKPMVITLSDGSEIQVDASQIRQASTAKASQPEGKSPPSSSSSSSSEQEGEEEAQEADDPEIDPDPKGPPPAPPATVAKGPSEVTVQSFAKFVGQVHQAAWSKNPQEPQAEVAMSYVEGHNSFMAFQAQAKAAEAEAKAKEVRRTVKPPPQEAFNAVGTPRSTPPTVIPTSEFNTFEPVFLASNLNVPKPKQEQRASSPQRPSAYSFVPSSASAHSSQDNWRTEVDRGPLRQVPYKARPDAKQQSSAPSASAATGAGSSTRGRSTPPHGAEAASSSHSQPVRGNTLAPPPSFDHAPNFFDRLPSRPPTTRYQPWREDYPRIECVFNQQVCPEHELSSRQDCTCQIAFDWHGVLDTMLTPVRRPTRASIEGLLRLEALGVRITIISYTGTPGYSRAFHQTMEFRNVVRMNGVQMGGGIFLTPDKCGNRGKSTIISANGIHGMVDDSPEIANECRRTGCWSYLFNATAFSTPEALFDFIISEIHRFGGPAAFAYHCRPRGLAPHEFSGTPRYNRRR